MAKSTVSANNTLDWQLGGANPTRPTTRYVSFHTADPGSTGASEVTTVGTGYARTSMAWNAAAAKSATNSGTIDITATGAFGPVTFWGVWDAVTAGNFLYGGAVTTSKTYATGDHLTVAAAALTVSEA